MYPDGFVFQEQQAFNRLKVLEMEMMTKEAEYEAARLRYKEQSNLITEKLNIFTRQWE